MARIAGIDLPRDKAVLYALPVLYGIGKHNVHELVEKAGVDPPKKIRDLDETEIGRIAAIASEEILYPEIARALALRGAEVFIHSSSEAARPSALPSKPEL